MAIPDRRRNSLLIRAVKLRNAARTLATELASAGRSGDGVPRPWTCWELHNPFSRAAAGVDSWALLDLCQSAVLLGAVRRLIGDDIILFDSQLWPNPSLPAPVMDAWQCDAAFYPLSAGHGVVVRLPFGDLQPRRYTFRAEPRVYDCVPGEAIVHRSDAEYRVTAAPGVVATEYVIRYFPALVRYVRDPENPCQRELAEAWPWVNYATFPLWLVHGTDRADNDFVTGFHTRIARWTSASAIGNH